MTVGSSADEILFEAATPLGFKVRVGRAHWEAIITMKHPVMAGREADVQNVLANPCEVRMSRSDEAVYLFYGKEAQHRKEFMYGPCEGLL
jgi:hypothetical protein